MLTCLSPVLFTFYIQSVLKLKKNNSGAKGLMHSLKGKTVWKMLCTFVTSIVGVLGIVMSLYHHQHAY